MSLSQDYCNGLDIEVLQTSALVSFVSLNTSVISNKHIEQCQRQQGQLRGVQLVLINPSGFPELF